MVATDTERGKIGSRSLPPHLRVPRGFGVESLGAGFAAEVVGRVPMLASRRAGRIHRHPAHRVTFLRSRLASALLEALAAMVGAEVDAFAVVHGRCRSVRHPDLHPADGVDSVSLPPAESLAVPVEP